MRSVRRICSTQLKGIITERNDSCGNSTLISGGEDCDSAYASTTAVMSKGMMGGRCEDENSAPAEDVSRISVAWWRRQLEKDIVSDAAMS